MRIAFAALFVVLISTLGFFGYYYFNSKQVSSENIVGEQEKPLLKYTIENLGRMGVASSKIELGKILSDNDEFVSRVFYFYVDGRKVSGQINYPNAPGIYPLIVMNRGYIERNGYKIGDGTRRSSEEFAKAGFVTAAPDFLGYGESDMPSDLPLEERFQTYTTVLTLLASIDSLNRALEVDAGVGVDGDKIGLWGHSNGGHIATVILEVTGKKYPTVLWAPVSKPFPYSILYYTDEFEDHGKSLRRVVSDFENNYDSDHYSLANYLDKINAPVSIHQGSQDEEVPIGWSNEFVLEIRRLGKDVEYHTYPEDDHNFTNGNWSDVVAGSVDFWRRKL